MSYLRYLCLLTYNCVQDLLCYVCLRLVYPMLAVSLDYPFLIGLVVLLNVYIQYKLESRILLVLIGFPIYTSRCWNSDLYLFKSSTNQNSNI